MASGMHRCRTEIIASLIYPRILGYRIYFFILIYTLVSFIVIEVIRMINLGMSLFGIIKIGKFESGICLRKAYLTDEIPIWVNQKQFLV
jgi:hypothetical protein